MTQRKPIVSSAVATYSLLYGTLYYNTHAQYSTHGNHGNTWFLHVNCLNSSCILLVDMQGESHVAINA